MAEKKKNIGGKATATAVAAVAAAGVLVGGAFASPDDILQDGPDALVQTVDMGLAPAAQVDDDGGAGADEGDEETGTEQSKRGLRAGVRRLVLSAPVGVRALVAVPLWCVGTALIALASALWTAVLSPAASTVLGWLAVALMVLAVFTLAVKTVFPDMPLKKILNRRSILTIVLLCVGFGALDCLLPLFWDGYEQVSRIVKVVGSMICTGVPVAFFLHRHHRKTVEAEVVEPELEEEPEEVELTMEEKEAAAKKLVLELADSVCPRY